MSLRWLTFGLSREEEERFRQANLGADIAQTRICILLILLPLVAFAINDYAFFRFSPYFFIFGLLRLALFTHSLLLFGRLKGMTDYRTYDNAEFAWALFFTLFSLAINAMRPHAYVAHTVVVVVAVFVTVLAIPNRFAYQLAISLIYTIGETLIIVPSLPTATQASVTALFSMYVANSIAVTCARQLHSWRRREFLAREDERKAKAEVDRHLAERRQIEEALERSETMLRSVLNQMPSGVTVRDARTGELVISNPRSNEIIGTPGRPYHSREWPVNRSMVTGEVVEGEEAEFEREDGTSITLSISSAPVRDLQGRIVMGVTIFHDITERRRAQETLRLSEEKYAKAFAINPAAIFMTRLGDGRVIEVNETWQAMFGYRRDEVVGRSSLDLGIWPTAEARYRRIRELQEKGSLRNVEETMVRRSGESFATLASAEMLVVAGEEVALSTWLDVSRQKEAETALRKARDELEVRVEERTSELREAYVKLEEEMAGRKHVEDQLRQAQKMEALGTLTGGIAHDFNNILASIIGFTEMALDDDIPRDSPARHHLALVLKGGFRGRDLIRQMLAFSRKGGPEMRPVMVNPLVKETAKLLRATIPSTIEVQVNVTSAPDMVLANASGLQQIVMNLSVNAAHAMRAAGGRLSISLSDTELETGKGLAPGPYFLLAVQDTGIGMDARVMERIFEPFFTTKGPGEGTGMGLAVVYGIVKSFKGDITVESTPGIGSIFRVFLPKARSEEAAEPVVLSEIPGGKERILFVDDEDALTEWGHTTLDRLGYEVTAMTDSREALSLFSADPSAFDLVITDQTMPGITGTDLSAELLALRPDIAIILCTGHSESVSPETAKELGIREFILKPLAKKELGEAVRRVLDGVIAEWEDRQSVKAGNSLD